MHENNKKGRQFLKNRHRFFGIGLTREPNRHKQTFVCVCLQNIEYVFVRMCLSECLYIIISPARAVTIMNYALGKIGIHTKEEEKKFNFQSLIIKCNTKKVEKHAKLIKNTSEEETKHRRRVE